MSSLSCGFMRTIVLHPGSDFRPRAKGQAEDQSRGLKTSGLLIIC